MDFNKLISECTAYDFKAEVEHRKSKSWLKSVSAFANGIGGSLFFGIDDDKNIVGIAMSNRKRNTSARLSKANSTQYQILIWMYTILTAKS